MANLLVRGLSDDIKAEVEKMAEEENLSMNQMLVFLLNKAVVMSRKEKEEEERRHEVFARVRKLRNRIRRKYGKFGDSTKLLREDRESH